MGSGAINAFPALNNSVECGILGAKRVNVAVEGNGMQAEAAIRVDIMVADFPPAVNGERDPDGIKLLMVR